jgi:hypothetical protein
LPDAGFTPILEVRPGYGRTNVNHAHLAHSPQSTHQPLTQQVYQGAPVGPAIAHQLAATPHVVRDIARLRDPLGWKLVKHFAQLGLVAVALLVALGEADSLAFAIVAAGAGLIATGTFAYADRLRFLSEVGDPNNLQPAVEFYSSEPLVTFEHAGWIPAGHRGPRTYQVDVT